MEHRNTQIALRSAQNTAVLMRREMAKNPAVLGALEPVERAVFLASTAKTVAEYDAAGLAAELATALKWICKDVGYRATDESDRQYLVIRTAEILKRYYAGLSMKDFRMAFEMSLTGELDDFLPRGRDGQPDRNHYQQFNAEYVCKILNAYKARRAWVLKKANEAVPAPSIQPSASEMLDYRNSIRRDIVMAFYEYKYRGRLPQMSPTMEMLFYNALSSVGLADDVEVTPAEQLQVLQRTISYYTGRGNFGDVGRLKETGKDDPELQHGSFVLARKKALRRALDRMIKDEVQITDFISDGR